MTIEQQVRQAKSPQEALLAVAKGLDLVLAALAEQAKARVESDPWQGVWTVDPGFGESRAYDVEGDEDETTVTIPPASEEKKAKRRELAVAMAIDQHQTFAGVEDLPEVYAKGGPVWLYTCDRDFVMSLPEHMRRAMVADIQEDDVQTAQEVGRDILKDFDNKGIALELAEQRDVQANG